jgi:hypothetical protein
MEYEYADIYYVDPRNAVRDHRPVPAGAFAGRLPFRPVQAVQSALPPAAPIGTVPAMTSVPVMSPVNQAYTLPMYAPNAAYGMAPWMTPPYAGNLAAILGGLGGLGSLAEVVAQVFAAVMPLPAAPAPVDTSESASTDTLANVKNLITYQSALASHAKRDEQLRTAGALLKRLVG